MLLLPVGDDNPHDTTPFLTWALLTANVILMLYVATLGQDGVARFYYRYGYVPGRSSAYALVTSAFLHGGAVHLAMNMLFLWIFGDNIEDRFGRFGFLVFYLGGAVVSALGFQVLSGKSGVPLVGASGAVSAVLGAYLVLFPWCRIKVFYWILLVFVGIWRVQAIVVIGVWFLGQYVAFRGGAATNVAHSAHIAGFVFGLAVTGVLRATGIVRVPRRRNRIDR